MARPSDPAAYQPQLSRWAHAGRLAAAALMSLVIFGMLAVTPATSGGLSPSMLLALEAVGGLTSFVLVCFRRRWPLTVAVVTASISAACATAVGPASLALLSVATRRQWREITLALVANVLATVASWFVYDLWDSTPGSLLSSSAVLGALVGWGLYAGSRRELLWTLRRRVEAAEAEQARMAEQARITERTRIAREMHDVVAHRISQVALVSGALTYREDLPPEQTRALLESIQQQSHAALEELRGVLGVLRSGHDEAAVAPQPSLDAIPALIEQSRAAGMRLDYRLELAVAPGEVPLGLGRTAYRVVQEAVTNAAKHAPGARCTVTVSGGPEAGITVTATNPLSVSSGTPGSGMGLLGLRERVELRDGTLQTGADGGAWSLRAWLPWAP